METKEIAVNVEAETKEKERLTKEERVKAVIQIKQNAIAYARKKVKQAEQDLAELLRDYDSLLLKSVDEIYEETVCATNVPFTFGDTCTTISGSIIK